jgi:hypothetical protein
MSDQSEFFLNSRSSVVQLELIELTHPNFTAPHRFVRNHADGVVVDLSPTELEIEFPYYPARVSPIGARDDLDAGVRIELGDLGDVVNSELDSIEQNNGWRIKPTVRYWAYRSDDLTAPIYGPLFLEATTLTVTPTGTAFDAAAPKLNIISTGERYSIDRFPMLRGFL